MKPVLAGLGPLLSRATFLPLGASVLLATSAVAQVPPSRAVPPIAAPTETAMFGGGATPVRFDRKCRDLTMATLATDAACAARVAAGETAPTIEVVSNGLSNARTLAEVRAAFAAIDKAIAVENHPAAQYVAGLLRTTSEVLTPDYARGNAHLERAVAGGNVAAADLLATMMLEGRGAPRDVPRGIALLERATAGGMANASVRLALLYVDGRLVPKDIPYATAILKAAESAGVPNAPRVLAALAKENTVNNYQLHPSADPSKVQDRRHGMLDNPRIPPALGSTTNSSAPTMRASATRRLSHDWSATTRGCRRRTSMNSRAGSFRSRRPGRAATTFWPARA